MNPARLARFSQDASEHGSWNNNWGYNDDDSWDESGEGYSFGKKKPPSYAEDRAIIQTGIDQFGKGFYAPRNLAYVGMKTGMGGESNTEKKSDLPALQQNYVGVGDKIAFQVLEFDQTTWSPAVSDIKKAEVVGVEDNGAVVLCKIEGKRQTERCRFDSLVKPKLVQLRPNAPPRPPSPKPKAKVVTKTPTKRKSPTKSLVKNAAHGDREAKEKGQGSASSVTMHTEKDHGSNGVGGSGKSVSERERQKRKERVKKQRLKKKLATATASDDEWRNKMKEELAKRRAELTKSKL